MKMWLRRNFRYIKGFLAVASVIWAPKISTYLKALGVGILWAWAMIGLAVGAMVIVVGYALLALMPFLLVGWLITWLAHL